MKKSDVDCFVFWSKNPKSLLDRIDELDCYNYYFQYTINSYGTDIESNVPSKSSELIDTFIKLSTKIGKEKVIWRYDPIILTTKYNKEWHIKYFEKLVDDLVLLCVDEKLKKIVVDNIYGVKCYPLVPREDYQNDIAYIELEKIITAIINCDTKVCV